MQHTQYMTKTFSDIQMKCKNIINYNIENQHEERYLNKLKS